MHLSSQNMILQAINESKKYIYTLEQKKKTTIKVSRKAKLTFYQSVPHVS